MRFVCVALGIALLLVAVLIVANQYLEPPQQIAMLAGFPMLPVAIGSALGTVLVIVGLWPQQKKKRRSRRAGSKSAKTQEVGTGHPGLVGLFGDSQENSK